MREIKLQDAERDGIDHVRGRVQSLDYGALGWYRCLDCRVSDGVEDLDEESWIS